ncbi:MULTISPECIES: hypothetical protein [Cupriavidus]
MMYSLTWKRNTARAMCVLGLATALAACNQAKTAEQAARTDHETFAAALNNYLAHKGDLCLAKYDWPVNVEYKDGPITDRNAVQMPVLEKLGVVTAKDTVVEYKSESGAEQKKVRQYALSAEGQKYYLRRPVQIPAPDGQVSHPGDLCVAKLTLDKVIGWEPPRTLDGKTQTAVMFTYKLDAAPWMRTPEALRAFPMAARVIEGTGTMQLREGFHLTPDGWLPNDDLS